MRPTTADRAHLDGSRFHNGYQMQVTEPLVYSVARDILVRIARDKSVLHIGCADHADLIEKKIANGTWLHADLAEVADRLVGIDTDAYAVAKLHEIGRGRGIVCGDVLTTIDLDGDGPWDVVMLPDIIEHLDDPTGFLAALRQRFGPFMPRLVVTVPNATSHQNHRFALRGVECINSDHRYWFTPYTLAKVATRAGWSVHDWSYTMRSTTPLRWRDCRRLERYPALRDTVIMRLGDWDSA